MLSAIGTKLGVGWGVVLSSLAFPVMHFDPRGSWLFKSNIFFFAVFACCWVIRTGNVWDVMSWHSAWNWLLAVGFEWRVTALDAHVPALLAKVIPVDTSF
jgi:membrane protease YdiL (CAAX protease family)